MGDVMIRAEKYIFTGTIGEGVHRIVFRPHVTPVEIVCNLCCVMMFII